MRLEQLRLRGFRNYESLTADFVPGVNLIVGDNAQGKTNLLEAITYLSMGHSFRTRKEQELIGMGAEFAELEAKLFSQGREQSIRAVLFPGRRSRQLYIGGVRQKTAAELPGILTTVKMSAAPASRTAGATGGHFLTTRPEAVVRSV